MEQEVFCVVSPWILLVAGSIVAAAGFAAYAFLSHRTKDGSISYDCAVDAMRQRHFVKAIRNLHDSLALRELPAENVHLQLARCYHLVGNLREADAHYDAVLDIDTANAAVKIERACMLRDCGQPEQYERAILELAAYKRSNHEVLLHAAYLNYARGRMEQAAKDLDDLLAGDAANAAALFLKARVLAGEGRWEEAVAYADKAILNGHSGAAILKEQAIAMAG